MRALERVLESLRPLVGKNGWEYCVVWKFGDHSTRYIEMLGCCCGGAKESHENEDHEESLQLCKDVLVPHLKRTKACDALADLPISIPITFGIHVEVLTSGQPRWISSAESNQTRVLVPLVGGLIEVFAAKQVPKDHHMIDLIIGQCAEEQEIQIAYISDNLKELAEEDMYSVPQSSRDGNHLVSLQSSTFNRSSLEYSNMILPDKELFSDCGNDKENKLTSLRKRARDTQKSRNLITERNRRDKLKSRILTLRSLVPNITKMDIQSTLGDSISYIAELENKVKTLQDEIKDMEEEEANQTAEVNNQLVVSQTKPEENATSHSSLSDISTDQSKHSQDSWSNNDLEQQMEPRVEVSDSGANAFTVKLIFGQKRGLFRSMMEAMNALGLDVTEANIYTVKGTVMSILNAEAKRDNAQVQGLQESLLELMKKGVWMDKA